MKSDLLCVPISLGELIDKITILMIKQSKITDTTKLTNINKELGILQEIAKTYNVSKKYSFLLYEINNTLWNIEDRIRHLESKQQFDSVFIETARQVYVLNDKRADIKKQINMIYNSDIIEEKSYSEN